MARRKPGALALNEDERRTLASWAADCAELALACFEAQSPHDLRPRQAIEGTWGFARGEAEVAELRRLSARAHAAARTVSTPAAIAAARAAGQAAATAHSAAHARDAAAYAAKAAGHASAAPDAASAELAWQVERASKAVRTVLRRLPAPSQAGGRLPRSSPNCMPASARRILPPATNLASTARWSDEAERPGLGYRRIAGHESST